MIPKKIMSPYEFAKTEEYQRRAYSYKFKRSIDDLKNEPVTYNGNVYCSSYEIKKKLNADFKQIKSFLAKNSWRFEGANIKLELGYLCTEREVTSVWMKLNDKTEIVIWVKDKADLREYDNATIASIFMNLWKESHHVQRV